MTLPPAQPPSTADVRAAAVRLAGKVRRTPVLELRGEDFGVAARVVLKLEHMQHTGSFKPRGALHALLTRDIPPAGVVAASGGNHGAAVAWAAARLSVPATIFVPATSPPAKAARIASYGAQVHVVDGFYDEAMVAAQTYAADLDVTSVHAFDEPAVVAGQGTLGLEVREQVPDASALLVTVGGGGLAAGVTLACRDGGPSIVPIEPDSCPTLAAALEAGGPVDVAVGGIAAD
ncbi:MAG TPA: pyridoxal-phosphate dependent enzyme, partial [Jiangellaceae bacterium]|nr:pyridoxal-phosphate dependent enzyme [Jiangellaceae bacterium]